MAKAIIIKKNGGPEVLELQDVKVGAPGPDDIKKERAAIEKIGKKVSLEFKAKKQIFNSS